PDLHRRGDRGHDALHNGPVDGLAGAGGVEVDDVHPRRAPGDEVAGHDLGVGAVDGLPGEVPLDETDTLPAPHVDGGEQVHHRAATLAATTAVKLPSRASPVGPD